MQQNYRSPYIVTKAMKNFLTASVLTLAINQLNTTVDGVVVSRFVSPYAFTTLNLYQPVLLVLMALYVFFGEGAGVAASRAQGELNTEKVNRLLSTSIASIIVIGLLVTIVGITFSDDIASLVCKEESLRGFFTDYLDVMMIFCVVNMLSLLMNTIVKTDGHPQLVSYSMIATGISNLGLDLLFVGVFGWGVKGAALASNLAMCINILILSTYTFSKRCNLHLRPISLFSFKGLLENMKFGTPFVVTNLVFMVLLLGLNIFIQEILGATGLYAWSLCVNLLMIGMMFVNGLGGLILGVGSFLTGLKDVRGIHFLVRVSLKFYVTIIFILVLIIEVWPGFISQLFGANTPELSNYANDCLRTFVPLLPFLFTALICSNLYQMNGILALPSAISLTFPLTLVVTLYIITLAGNVNIWIAFPICGVIVFCLTMLGSYMVYRKRRDELLPVTLVPRLPKNNTETLDISIRTSTSALIEPINRLNDFLHDTDLSEKMYNDVKICIEEVIRNVAQYSSPKTDKHYFDLIVRNTEKDVNVSVMDDGMQFNPFKFKVSEGSGFKILRAYCDCKEYKYMYGINMTFLSWNKTQSDDNKENTKNK